MRYTHGLSTLPDGLQQFGQIVRQHIDPIVIKPLPFYSRRNVQYVAGSIALTIILLFAILFIVRIVRRRRQHYHARGRSE